MGVEAADILLCGGLRAVLHADEPVDGLLGGHHPFLTLFEVVGAGIGVHDVVGHACPGVHLFIAPCLRRQPLQGVIGVGEVLLRLCGAAQLHLAVADVVQQHGLPVLPDGCLVVLHDAIALGGGAQRSLLVALPGEDGRQLVVGEVVEWGMLLIELVGCQSFLVVQLRAQLLSHLEVYLCAVEAYLGVAERSDVLQAVYHQQCAVVVGVHRLVDERVGVYHLYLRPVVAAAAGLAGRERQCQRR